MATIASIFSCSDMFTQISQRGDKGVSLPQEMPFRTQILTVLGHGIQYTNLYFVLKQPWYCRNTQLQKSS
eukprot:3670678-Rhodomonas_salina.3